jgi:hypothetical protein
MRFIDWIGRIRPWSGIAVSSDQHAMSSPESPHETLLSSIECFFIFDLVGLDMQKRSVDGKRPPLR